jgi:hypothetical protein
LNGLLVGITVDIDESGKKHSATSIDDRTEAGLPAFLNM